MKAHKNTEKTDTILRLNVVAILEGLILCILLLTQISAVSKWQKRNSENIEINETHLEMISDTTEMIEKVAEEIRSKMTNFHSQTAFADKYNFNKRDVSHILNRKSISARALKNMVAKLGMND